MEELDLELILRVLQENYAEWHSMGSPCTRIKKQIEILEKLLTKEE